MAARILITATTSGLGRGLLEHYAATGWNVVAFNRRCRARRWRFKTLTLGPIATNIAVGSTLSSRFQSALRDFLTITVEQAVPLIARFAESGGATFRYPAKSVAVFLAAAAAAAPR